MREIVDRLFRNFVLVGAIAVAIVVSPCSRAGAAVTHRYLPEVSERISEGVPVGCGGGTEPPCISGPLSELQALTVVSGEVWVGDRIEGMGSRVDEFEV
jgi:hypothetical protein